MLRIPRTVGISEPLPGSVEQEIPLEIEGGWQSDSGREIRLEAPLPPRVHDTLVELNRDRNLLLPALVLARLKPPASLELLHRIRRRLKLGAENYELLGTLKPTVAELQFLHGVALALYLDLECSLGSGQLP